MTGTSPAAASGGPRVRIAYATEGDMDAVLRLRHEAYARELGQHPVNDTGRLTDALDGLTTYLVATVDGVVAGFVTVTPPSAGVLSLDKYVPRQRLPFAVDERVHEVRLLTVDPGHRGTGVAPLLIYAAFRHVEAAGGDRIVGMGHGRALAMYLRSGARLLGIGVTSGALAFELFTVTIDEARAQVAANARLLQRLESCEWALPFPLREPV